MKLNVTAIWGKNEELIKYQSYLPSLVTGELGPKNYRKYTDNLKDKGLFDEYMEKVYEVRMTIAKLPESERYSYLLNELEEWVKANPEYSDFIDD